MKRKPIKKEKGSLLEPQFRDEDKAREFLEAMRWPDGAICPHCGLVGEAYKLTPKPKEPVPVEYQTKDELKKQRVRKPRKGLWKCAGCRKQFSVTVKTIFEDSHIPLNKWLLAIHLMCSSKKGISAHQLMRNLDIKQYKSAWFMAHRIRYAMTGELPEQMMGIVEADETYVGGKPRVAVPRTLKPGVRAQDHPSPFANKAIVFSVLQRGGKVRSAHLERIVGGNLKTAILEVCAPDTHVMTDDAKLYRGVKKERKHSSVNHTEKEYVRWEDGVCVTTNTVEGFFANLKRGIIGTYHHVSKTHLHRYLSEFDFRYNERKVTDGERAQTALKGFEGKRLTYRDS
jgi:transposase-like protein